MGVGVELQQRSKSGGTLRTLPTRRRRQRPIAASVTASRRRGLPALSIAATLTGRLVGLLLLLREAKLAAAEIRPDRTLLQRVTLLRVTLELKGRVLLFILWSNYNA